MFLFSDDEFNDFERNEKKQERILLKAEKYRYSKKVQATRRERESSINLCVRVH